MLARTADPHDRRRQHLSLLPASAPVTDSIQAVQELFFQELFSGFTEDEQNPFEEVDEAYKKAVENGATSVLEPELEPWGQRTCYIADPEGNLIEIGSWNKPYEEKDLEGV